MHAVIFSAEAPAPVGVALVISLSKSNGLDVEQYQ